MRATKSQIFAQVVSTGGEKCAKAKTGKNWCFASGELYEKTKKIPLKIAIPLGYNEFFCA